MALLKTLTIGQLSLSVTDSYIKIEEVITTKDRGVSIRYSVYASQEASDTDGVSPVATLGEQVDFPENAQMPGANPIQWAYNQLKARPEFAGATDV